jgi:hypothetical protein
VREHESNVEVGQVLAVSSAAGERTRFFRPVQWAFQHLHWIVSGVLAVALVPVFMAVKLPLRINWPVLTLVYWVGVMSQSIFAAALLYVIGFPLQETLLPLLEHYKRQKPRVIFLAIFAGGMFWQFGWGTGLLIVVDGIALAELADRAVGDGARLRQWGWSVFVPAAYFFVGLLLIFCFSDVIATLRFFGGYDSTFNRLDTFLFHGITVSHVCRAAARQLPLWLFRFLEFVYYNLFAQVGAALLISALYTGKREALRLVGTLLTAYYLALIVCWFLPNVGPFYSHGQFISALPRSLATYKVQESLCRRAMALWVHKAVHGVTADYYIGFPSMHVALSIIALWFFRPWKRIVAVLLVCDVLLLAAVVLLEWHYFVDLLGGVLVAGLAIAMVNRRGREPGFTPPRVRARTVESAGLHALSLSENRETTI